MSFDSDSNSCYSCPFGCISCIKTSCTSCIPGYFLFISPLITSCRKKNPFNPCEKEYSWQQDSACMITDYKELELS